MAPVVGVVVDDLEGVGVLVEMLVLLSSSSSSSSSRGGDALVREETDWLEGRMVGDIIILTGGAEDLLRDDTCL